MDTTIRKELKAKSGLDGIASKVIIPGSTTTTEDIGIRKGDGPDVFYYQHNVTTSDQEAGTSKTVNGELEQFNPVGSWPYREGGWSEILRAAIR